MLFKKIIIIITIFLKITPHLVISNTRDSMEKTKNSFSNITFFVDFLRIFKSPVKKSKENFEN